MRKYFGTDGIRGKVGCFPITPDFALRLGYAAGKVLAAHSKKPSVIIGKDTRLSGYLFESSLEAGFAYAGVDVYMAGPIPKISIDFLTGSVVVPAISETMATSIPVSALINELLPTLRLP